MANDDHAPSARVRWARLRFQILGTLMAAPADDGELKARIEALAARGWRHPTTGESLRFSFKTIERWWYIARGAKDPFAALARKVPSHAGTHPSISAALAEAIARQHRDHPRWTWQLHHDNLVALAREDPHLGPVPAYATVCRFMRGHGLVRARKRRHWQHPEGEPFVTRETRSYEVSHVHGLWHLDFHQGSRPVLGADGQWQKPQLLGVLDDRSRLCCHLQWYLEETAEALIHGLSQAFHKRGLPRALLTDNGAAMIAAETVEGLERLGVVHHTTLPYSPEQNGKQESFWGQIEGRLLPMLEGEPECSLDLLNTATQAWAEEEYQRKEHSEIRETPLARYMRGPSVARESPAPMPCGVRSAPRSRANSDEATAPSPPAACASRFPRPTARCSNCVCASLAGTSPASTWSTRAPETTWPRCCPSTRPATPSVSGASSIPPPPTSHSHPPASPRICARSWPTTPPPACPPPTCQNTIRPTSTPRRTHE
jgi:transposase InsO family protein